VISLLKQKGKKAEAKGKGKARETSSSEDEKAEVEPFENGTSLLHFFFFDIVKIYGNKIENIIVEKILWVKLCVLKKIRFCF
jgi:hypothetical protein